jgi:hypothetical protein
MNQVHFINQKSLLIVSNKIKNDIQNQINNIGSFNLTSKYYTFLNKKNINNVKENNYNVTLSTFGKKYILFITTYNNNKYCIFINKKNNYMNILQLKFSDDIFLGTLLDGELLKNNNDKWIYLISDISYYKGQNIITKSFYERQIILSNMLKNEHEDYDNKTTFYLSKKTYFEYKYIKDLTERYIKALNYNCSGLYFKNINNFSDNYLFIFPECRSDSKILNETNEINKDTKKEEKDENEEDNLFKDCDVVDMSNNKIIIDSNITKDTCCFLIKQTLQPDIYELHCKIMNNIEKDSYASVPDMDTSMFLNQLFNHLENKNIYVECKYHKVFKKWIPFKIANQIDDIYTINQIKVRLDNE